MSIADAFEGVAPTRSAPAVQTPAAAPQVTRIEVLRPAKEDAAGVEPSWLSTVGSGIAADWSGAWLWDARGVTIRALWDNRIPDRDAVPGANRVLWAAWCAYNHAAVAVLSPLLFAAWVLCHPGRLIYAAPVAAALIALWLT